MSKKAKPLSVFDLRKLAIETLAHTLPTDIGARLAVCKLAGEDYGRAVEADNGDAAEAARQRYEASIYAMNDFDRCGTFGSEDAPGNVAAKHCAAAPGTVPSWGQRGEFLIVVDGMRIAVRYDSPMTSFSTHFQFYAVDMDRPFLSETGYRSHFVNAATGCVTVDEAAAMYVQAFIQKGSVMIERKAFCREHGERFAWFTDHAAPLLQAAVIDTTGQFGFAF